MIMNMNVMFTARLRSLSPPLEGRIEPLLEAVFSDEVVKEFVTVTSSNILLERPVNKVGRL